MRLPGGESWRKHGRERGDGRGREQGPEQLRGRENDRGREPAAFVVGRRVAAGCAALLATLIALVCGISPGAALGASSSPLGGSLVIAESPMEGEQVGAAEEAHRRSPEALVARKESRTKFAHLNAAAAAGVAGEAFPELIREPNGGPPKLSTGQRITGYINAHAAHVNLGDNENGIVQSLTPMAIPTTHGWAPVDLNLHETGNGYTPENPVADVRIPKNLSEGVQAPSSGLSLTPVSAGGASLGGSGSIDGATVLFANTQTDADTIVKPSTLGFAVNTILRSPESPEQLYFHIGLPPGASLVQEKDAGPAQVQVVKEGVTIATIPVPRAQDAAGASVPASTRISGDILILDVNRKASEYQYPIDVDPEFNTLPEPEKKFLKIWEYQPHGSGFYYGETESEMWLGHHEKEGSMGQAADLAYQTNGDSKIYQASIHVTELDPSAYFKKGEGPSEESFASDNVFDLALLGEVEKVIAQEWTPLKEVLKSQEVCPVAGCSPGNGNEHNAVALNNSLGANVGWDQLRINSASVSIAQPKETHSTIELDTTKDAELETRPNTFTTNVLYGSGRWLSEHTGALKFTAADKGVGIAETRLETDHSGYWQDLVELNKKYIGTSSCRGIQCPETLSETMTYANFDGQGVSNGEEKLRFAADDAMEHTWSSEHGEGEFVLKVDTKAPHGLAASGLPAKGEEFELGEVEKTLKVEATDGEGSGESATPSSGVKSIALYIDSKEFGQPSGGCTVPHGACTAHGEWSLSGTELGAGTHTLTIVATDNALNVERKTYILNVYPASPASMGPGSVNPESGDFALGAADVGVSGGTGSLSVTRHYDSLNLREGEEGPLGPQWSTSLGGLASLEVLPDKSVMVVGPEGITHFSVASGGGFEAPAGDTNLKLEAKENEGKEITEYLLKDAKKGTTTRFTHPSGAKSWMPTTSEGPIPSDTVTDTYQTAEALNEYATPASPWGIASGPEGNLWFTQESNAIGEITPTGFKKEFSSLPINGATGITKGADGNTWFVNSESNEVYKLAPSGHLSEYNASTGWNAPRDITEGPDENVWFTHPGGTESGYPGSIVKMNTGGSATPFSPPAESNPENIVPGPENDMWFTNGWCKHNSGKGCKVGKITESGSVTEYPLESRWEQANGVVGGPNGEQAVWFTMSGPSAGEGDIVRMTPSGTMTKYALPAKSYPQGITVGPDGNLWFTEWESSKIGKVTPKGEITEYSLPGGSEPYHIAAGPDGKLWFTEYGSDHIGTISTAGVIIEPSLEIAPHPTVSCSQEQVEKLEIAAKGCRALKFTYAKATTTKGEKPTEWGEFNRRLMKVSFIGYNPSVSKMESNVVAEYAYDQTGRLRAEWNPQASSELKTTYGYDAAGHITALTSPGQQPWAFTYGTIAGNPSSGRLLKVTQAQPKAGASEAEVKTKLAEQAEPASNTEAPKLTGTPAVGVKMAVSKGTWTHSPFVYGFQWYDCNASGEECTSIPGATNANYTPAASDVGHALIALVTATNGGGSVVARTAASVTVVEPASEYAPPESSSPHGIASGPDGNLWYADFGTNKISKITTAGIITEYSLPAGSYPIAIAKGPDGNLWYTDYGTSKIGKITTSGTITEYALPAGSDPEGINGIVAGPDGNLWYASTRTSKIGKITTSGTITEYALPEKSKPESIAAGSDGNLWYTDQQSNKIGKITTSGAITEYSLPAGSSPESIAAGSDGNLWYTDDGTSKIGKITTAGAITEYELPASSAPKEITKGPEGNLWYVDYTTSKIGRITTSGVVAEYALPSKSGYPLGIAAGPDGNLWYTSANNRIGKFAAVTEGEAQAPEQGSTIEYGVPVSGKAAPYKMTKQEIAKWGQKESEIPAYATAIFPPDEPQGWPASSYKRATITYLDSQARAVNSAFPTTSATGSISTREYNEENQVTRSLSADNRAAALKEECKSETECKSAEVANLLSTTSAYNGEGQLTDSWGPQHMVKLVKGKEGKSEEVLARNHVKYHYDEGAAEAEAKNNESYELVTKTEDGAETVSKEEFDKRVTTSSYSGQEDLGWKLRTPTLTTVDPGGLNLTTTTVFQEVINGEGKKEATGSIEETKSPGVNSAANLSYAASFGTKGAGAGQVSGADEDAIDGAGDVWIADNTNNRVDVFSSSGAFIETIGWGVTNGKAEAEVCTSSCQAGIEGGGNGEFKHPWGIAINKSAGDVYVSDQGNNRIEELEVSTGKWVRSFGAFGKGEGQFNSPNGVAVDPSGNVWVTDYGFNRIEEFSSTGSFTKMIGWGVRNGEAKLEKCIFECREGLEGSGEGQFKGPKGIATDASGNVYVTDFGNNRVEELSSSGAFLGQFGSAGSGNGQFSGPVTLAVDPNTGNVLVTDQGNSRVQEFSPSHAYIGQFGTSGSGNGQFASPQGIAVNNSSYAYVVDSSNGRIQQWAPPGSARSLAYGSSFGSKGAGAGQISGANEDAVDASGDVWVADSTNNRIDEFSPLGSFVEAIGWGVGSAGKSEVEVCTSSCKAGIEGGGSGEFKHPWGIAVNRSAGDVYVSDQSNNRIEEFEISTGKWLRSFGSFGKEGGEFNSPNGVAVDSSGNVWVTDYGFNRIEEFSSTGTFKEAIGWGVSNGESKLETCTTASSCKEGLEGNGEGEFKGPKGIATDASGNVYVTDFGNNRVEELSASGSFLGQFGSSGAGNGQFSGPVTLAVDPNTGNVLVTDQGNSRVQEFSPAHTYIGQFGASGSGNGQFASPQGIAINNASYAYVVDSSNNRIQQWAPQTNGSLQAHDSRTIYYSTAANVEFKNCGERPEWAGLVCETVPVAQPGVSGMPELPVATVSYNMWDQPEKTEETFGTGAGVQTRTKKITYNAAGGVLTSEVTSSPTNEKEHKELPQVVNTYNKATGVLEEQSAKTTSGTKTIVTKYNTLGQITTYTDADGNTATFEYEPEKDDRLVKVSDSKGYQTYHYNETTGLLTELVDSAAGAFKAEYDLAGKLTTETYPNAMTATYTHNQVGEMTAVEYTKTAHCEKTCPEVWFSDTVVPSVHGETLKQNSTLSEEPSYTYDNAGRLIQAQEIPTGEGCKTRVYAYEEEGNRTSETTREPAAEGKCASEGGSTEVHTYDTANQMTDPGVTYETFGNTTKLPAADADGSELVSEYYVDSQVAKQEQGGEKIEYKLDPEDRTRETISTGNTASTVITHYDGSGDAVAWTGEGSGETEKWTRNIPGIEGSLTATEAGEGKTGKPAVLLLHDLQGNVVAEAGISETETKLQKKFNSTEFGVPSGKGAPPKYAWLGAAGVAGELPSGVITQDGVTYVPQTGRPLETESVVLPAVVNTPTPMGKLVEEWVGIKAGEGGARLVAAAEQERVEREAAEEAANRPPGLLPMPEGQFCGEEYGPCVDEGEPEAPGGGCSGKNACAASTHKYIPKNTAGGHDGAGCQVTASWGEPFYGGSLRVYGHFTCYLYYPIHFELQVCLEEQASGGGFQRLDCPVKGSYHSWTCTAGALYRAWAWGRYWDGAGTIWWEKAYDGNTRRCSANAIGDPGGKYDE